MGYRYGHRATAFSGVFNHVINKYPKAKDILGFYDKIPIDQRHCRCNLKGIYDLMKEYISSKGDKPNKDFRKNAQYIQKDFQSFIKYCQLKLK